MAESFTIGPGSALGISPYIGGDEYAAVSPFLSYRSGKVSVGFPDGLRMTFLDRDAFRLYGVGQPHVWALPDSDASELAGIDREITLDGGLVPDYRLAPGAPISPCAR